MQELINTPMPRNIFMRRNLKRACRPRTTVCHNSMEWVVGEGHVLHLLRGEDYLRVIK
jgi:hypothetical protein